MGVLIAAPSCRRDDPPPPTAAELLAKLDGPDFFAAAKQLATFEDRGALAAHLPELVAALDHDDWQVRSLAAEAIGRVGAKAIPALVAVLDAGPARAQPSAVEAMGHIGVAAVTNMRDALGHGNEAVRQQAQMALRELGAAAVQPLIEALLSDDEVLRSNAAQTVYTLQPGALTAHTQPVVMALFNALGKTNDDAALWPMVQVLLNNLGPAGLSVIVTELRNEHPAVHRVVFSALSTIDDERLKAFTPQYAAQLTIAVIPFLDRDGGGRHACAVFERLGPRANAAVPALVARLHARAAERKERGETSIAWPDCPAYALAKIGSAAVEPAIKLLASSDNWVRAQALMLLAEIGPPAKPAATAIETLIRDEPSLRPEGEKTLDAIGARR